MIPFSYCLKVKVFFFFFGSLTALLHIRQKQQHIKTSAFMLFVVSIGYIFIMVQHSNFNLNLK